VEHGQLDLVLHIDDGLLPSHFQSERLYREDWVCAVAHDNRFGDSLSLKQYLAANHIVVATYAGVQTIPDKQLAAVGAKRNSCIRVPYFGVALQCLAGTELVLTLTSGMTPVVKANRKLRLVKAPQELHAFHFLMAWHPRHNTDPRHVWLSGSQSTEEFLAHQMETIYLSQGHRPLTMDYTWAWVSGKKDNIRFSAG